MAEDEPANIFEAARQMFGGKKKKKKKPSKDSKEIAPEEASSTASSTVAAESTAPATAVETPRASDLSAYSDIEASFAKIEKYHQELNDLIRKTCTKAKITPKELRRFLHTESNFAPSEWEFMRRERKKESEKLWKMAGEDAKRRYMKKVKKRKSIKRKKRFLGARRKNWIQVK